jgi:hypothetical protein
MMREQTGAGASEVGSDRFQTLERIARSQQGWPQVSHACGVTNPVPPWKSSLDGMCDALDRSGKVLAMVDRRREEDLLSEEVYSVVPSPESQLVALAHSLLARGVIDEHALARRMEAVRARLEAV